VNSFARRAVTLASGGLLAVIVSTAAGGAASAAPNPSGTGQPSVECGDKGAETHPGQGHAEAAPGSPFNDAGVAGTVYAGEQPQNSRNDHSVSQYDVACFQVSHQQ
jgi:hypothetical protein